MGIRLELLQYQISPQIEERSVYDETIWHQQDGCAANIRTDVVNRISKASFPISWIGRGGAINWHDQWFTT